MIILELEKHKIDTINVVKFYNYNKIILLVVN